MRQILSLLAGAALSGADLGLLALAVKGLGTRAGGGKVFLLFVLAAGKLGLLVAGFWALSRMGWFDRPWGLGGLMTPFSLFIAWAFLKQRRMV